MLAQLYIRNIAVVKEALIEFGDRLNVFTGETGAGKSILIGAIGAVLGGRTSKDLIRTGETKAVVSALFRNLSVPARKALSELGYECGEGEELPISREIGAEHNTCRINGQPATVALLRAAGQHLINVHGQQDNQMLFSADAHRNFVDSFAGLGPEVEAYRAEYREMAALSVKLESITMDEAEKARKIDLLSFQVNEIDEANLRPGEEEELDERRRVIRNAERIASSLLEAKSLLAGDDDRPGAIDALEQASGELSEASRYLAAFSAPAQALEGYRYELDELVEQIRDALGSLEYDPRELEEIEERLDLIYRLKRKYGADIPAILAFRERTAAELREITLSDEQAAELRKALAGSRDKVLTLSRALSKKRAKAGEALSRAVEAELSALDMPSVRLEVALTAREPGPHGAEDVAFLISANPGEPAKPLSKIASGGEMSRVMLAIKSVVSGKDDIDTLIFDEIDTGVSGRAAQKIGAKLRKVAESRQVICVTHLAPVAAFAGRHLLISKEVEDGRTYTTVQTLSREERIRELARITGGENITELALKSSEEMLSLAQRDAEPET